MFVPEGFLLLVLYKLNTHRATRSLFQGGVSSSSTKRKGPGKRGHIVADTLVLMMFLELRKLGNICCGQNVSEENQKHFCVPDIKFVSPTNVARAGKQGNICVGNNVSSFARALTASVNSAYKQARNTFHHAPDFASVLKFQMTCISKN